MDTSTYFLYRRLYLAIKDTDRLDYNDEWSSAFEKIRGELTNAVHLHSSDAEFIDVLVKHFSAVDLLYMGLHDEAEAKMHAKDFDPHAKSIFIYETIPAVIYANQFSQNHIFFANNARTLRILATYVKKGGLMKHYRGMTGMSGMSMLINPIGDVKTLPRIINTINHFETWLLQAAEKPSVLSESLVERHTKLRDRIISVLKDYHGGRRLHSVEQPHLAALWTAEQRAIQEALKTSLRFPPNDGDIAMTQYIRETRSPSRRGCDLNTYIKLYSSRRVPRATEDRQLVHTRIKFIFNILEAGADPESILPEIEDRELRELIMNRYSRKRRSMALLKVFKRKLGPEALAIFDAKNIIPAITNLSF